LNRDGFAVTVCLDAVADLGDFAEVEILAEEDRLPAAQTVLATLAAELGLSAIEKGSYLGLVLARLGESKK
jgi:adenylate cyclase class IV